jgi:hypothetical protein
MSPWYKNLTGRHFKKPKMIAIKEIPVTPAPREKLGTIIIGAGLSGLYAACLLTKEKKPFVVLEARDRVGGRILSIEYQDYYSDIGPPGTGPISTRKQRVLSRPWAFKDIVNMKMAWAFFKVQTAPCIPCGATLCSRRPGVFMAAWAN